MMHGVFAVLLALYFCGCASALSVAGVNRTALYSKFAFSAQASASSRVLFQKLLQEPADCLAIVDHFLKHELLSSLDQTLKQQLRSVVSDSKRELLVTSTRHTMCMFDNFLEHAKKLGGVKIVHVSMDEPSQQFCLGRSVEVQGVELSCVDFSAWLPIDIEDFGPHALQVDNVGFGTCLYQLATWVKPAVLSVAAAAATDGLLMIDTDVVLFGQLQDWCAQNKRPDAQLVAGDEYAGLPNSGTVFVTKGSSPMLKAWVGEARVGDPTGDQAGLHRVLQKNSGKFTAQIIPRSVVGECAGRGALAAHFNCVKDKILAMTQQGLWSPASAQCR